MSRLKNKPYLSVADYLAGERDADVRHEYVDGQVYAMAGASDRHNRIAGNFLCVCHYIWTVVSANPLCPI